MIITELVSNSLKHAFPGDSVGEICLEFRSVGDGHYNLIVEDNGIGMGDVDLSNLKTLGIELIDTLVKQLSGKLRFDTTHGTRYEIRFQEKKKVE